MPVKYYTQWYRELFIRQCKKGAVAQVNSMSRSIDFNQHVIGYHGGKAAKKAFSAALKHNQQPIMQLLLGTPSIVEIFSENIGIEIIQMNHLVVAKMILTLESARAHFLSHKVNFVYYIVVFGKVQLFDLIISNLTPQEKAKLCSELFCALYENSVFESLIVKGHSKMLIRLLAYAKVQEYLLTDHNIFCDAIRNNRSRFISVALQNKTFVIKLAEKLKQVYEDYECQSFKWAVKFALKQKNYNLICKLLESTELYDLFEMNNGELLQELRAHIDNQNNLKKQPVTSNSPSSNKMLLSYFKDLKRRTAKAKKKCEVNNDDTKLSSHLKHQCKI